MRRRGRDRYHPAQARLDAMWLRMGILGEEDFSRRSRSRKRYDSAQRPLGHGAPVKCVDLETGAVTWQRPLDLSPVVHGGQIVGWSLEWVTCEPPKDEMGGAP